MAFDNGCYAYEHAGNPYEGSQVAVRVLEWGPDGRRDHGVYLNTGVYHAPGGDHPYCYVAQIDENGEDQDGLRVACPVWFEMPYLLRGLP